MNMKKCLKKGIILKSICLLIVVSFFVNTKIIQTTNAATYSEAMETITQGFEQSMSNQVEWDYANEDHFDDLCSESGYVKEDQYSMKALAKGSSGVSYDGVQHQDFFADGSIECWIYPRATQYHSPALWLRTSSNDGTGTHTLKSGYMLRIYKTYANIYFVDETSIISLCSNYYLGGYINNKWWHMKFEVYNDKYGQIQLRAWVTTNADFPTSPDFSTEITNGEYVIECGKAGFSARTNMQTPNRYCYFDGIKIKYDVHQWREQFETEPFEGWDFANPTHYDQNDDSSYVKEGDYSLKAKALGGVGKVYDGVQLNEKFENGSIEGWIYPRASEYLSSGLWLRTSTNDATGVCTFEDGYFLRIYYNYAAIYHSTYSGSQHVLTSLCSNYNLGQQINNRWWYLKFKVTNTPDGSIFLEGWVTRSSSFSDNPQLSVEVTNENYKIESGKAGFSARTSLQPSRYTYFDDLRIKIPQDSVDCYAVIVGVGDYDHENNDGDNETIYKVDCSDEDVTDWYNHFTENLNWKSENIKIYGDQNSSKYPKYSGEATESNVVDALDWLIDVADRNDVIVFIFSGHGNGDDSGSSCLCMNDYETDTPYNPNTQGSFTDTELQNKLKNAISERIFVFLASCKSGGFGVNPGNLLDESVMPNKDNIFLTTTCRYDGFGYMDGTPGEDDYNIAWTHSFLEVSWIDTYGGSPTTSCETIFNKAHTEYPFQWWDHLEPEYSINPWNEPHKFDGNTGDWFYIPYEQ